MVQLATSGVKVVRAGDGIAVCEVANVCVVLWRGPVTRPRFEIQRDGLEEVIGRHPGGIGFFCVIEPTASPPNDELRRASAGMVAKHLLNLSAIVCVVEGNGFSKAVGRSALSAMALLLGSRRPPLSVFDSTSAGATWMVPHVDVRDAVAIARAVETARGAIEPWGRDRR